MGEFSEKEQNVLETVARFEPLSQDTVEAAAAACEWYEVEQILNTLDRRGFIRQDNEQQWWVDTDPFHVVEDAAQRGLGDDAPNDRSVVVAAALPDDIETGTMTLSLTEEQALLFEQMRADVSRTCGYMSRSAFVDWVLREARRMTEV